MQKILKGGFPTEERGRVDTRGVGIQSLCDVKEGAPVHGGIPPTHDTKGLYVSARALAARCQLIVAAMRRQLLEK